MAARCPNCGRKLKWYEVRAECKGCGANIPNFNWEARLEADADAAETAFARLHYRLDNFKSGTVGSPLRIVRLVVTLLPLVGLVVPLLNATLSFPFYESTQSVSFLTFVLDYLTKYDLGSVFALMSGEILGGLFTSLVLAAIFALLAVAAGVINFFAGAAGRDQSQLAHQCDPECHQPRKLGAFGAVFAAVHHRRRRDDHRAVFGHGVAVVSVGTWAVPFGSGHQHRRRCRASQAEKDAAHH